MAGQYRTKVANEELSIREISDCFYDCKRSGRGLH